MLTMRMRTLVRFTRGHVLTQVEERECEFETYVANTLLHYRPLSFSFSLFAQGSAG